MSTIVIAVGNGAGNVVDDFRHPLDVGGVEYLYLDENAQDLEHHGIGKERKAVLERSCKTLGSIFAERYDVAVLVVCLGGFTGNYYADAIAEELRGRCEKLVCIASLPFGFEGRLKLINASASLGNIIRWCDLTATQDNECLSGIESIREINDPMVALLGVLQPLNSDAPECESATIDHIRDVWMSSCERSFPKSTPNGLITIHPKRADKV